MWNLVYFTKNDVNTFTQTYSREHFRGGKSFIISINFFFENQPENFMSFTNICP